jgi:hypothetical protein
MGRGPSHRLHPTHRTPQESRPQTLSSGRNLDRIRGFAQTRRESHDYAPSRYE